MRAFVTYVAAAALFVTGISHARADSYPNRPITWVIPSGAGSASDANARVVAKVLGDKLGQPILIDNRPGAGGIVAAEFVAQAKPDGYTMLYATSGPVATFAAFYKKLSYQPLQAFVPVHGFLDTSFVLVANATKPYKTIEAFVDYLKKNPGKVNYASQGTATTPHLSGELFQMATDTRMEHVPYKTAANFYADLLAGNVDVVFDYGASVKPYIETGKVRPIATTAATRLKNFPDVPTLKERNIDMVFGGWSCIVMPAGTPPDVVNTMSAKFADAMRDPTVVQFLDANDYGTLTHLGPADLKAFIASEIERFKKLADKTGISLD
jgi:tripartite-type tricarboxylate transporter receptor subunit TctC